MTKNIEIIARYRAAGADERLYLFLQFPELRTAFQDIDLEEYFADQHDTGSFDLAA